MLLNSDDLIHLVLAFEEIVDGEIDRDLKLFGDILVLQENILSGISVKQPHIAKRSLDF